MWAVLRARAAGSRVAGARAVGSIAAASMAADARAAVERVVSVVEAVRLMGATSLTEGWAVARQQRVRMQQRAVRSSRT